MTSSVCLMRIAVAVVVVLVAIIDKMLSVDGGVVIKSLLFYAYL